MCKPKASHSLAMSKRATIDRPADTPAPKQPRAGEDTPATALVRPHGRVVLDVGGTRFVSSKTTLEGSSAYFSALLARWDEHTEEALFIDGDADAFQPLLSYMRFGKLTLPEHDIGLCERVLLQAEYLGMDTMLDEVKAQAFANLNPDTHQFEARPLSRAFDEDVGSLAEALRSKVLPARYFGPAPKPPPEPPLRTIKALLPAAPGYRALFTNDKFDHGEAREIEDDDTPADSESLQIINWALVEYRDGTQRVDAIVQRALESTKTCVEIERDHADDKTYSHMVLASEYDGHALDAGLITESKHWVVVPPRAPEQMLPIPPGSVRGLWAKPALTEDDKGKSITIDGNKMIVDGDVRNVQWSGDAPTDISNAKIANVRRWDEYNSSFQLESGLRRFELPCMANEGMEIDLAFASVQGDASGNIKTEFYMPVNLKGPYEQSQTVLSKVSGVSFGERRFSHFVGAKRS